MIFFQHIFDFNPPAPSPAGYAEIAAVVDSFIPADPSVESDDKQRLNRQQRLVLKRLKRGPATNVELHKICFNYTARLHELKNKGYPFAKEKVSKGVFKYWLV